jgi:hypothetical protein
MKAAKAFFRSARARMGFRPDRVTTEGHGPYPQAIRTVLGPVMAVAAEGHCLIRQNKRLCHEMRFKTGIATNTPTKINPLTLPVSDGIHDLRQNLWACLTGSQAASGCSVFRCKIYVSNDRR